MHKYSTIGLLCALLAVSLASPAFAGKVVVFTDEWWSSNTGFAAEGASGNAFTDNLVSAFGGAGNYLIYSSNSIGLLQSSFDNRLIADGAVLTFSTSASQSLAGFKGVFLAGPIDGGVAPNATALINYVIGGGNVFLEGGTSSFAGGAAGESAAWAPFLSAFGISYSTSYDTGGASGCTNYPVNSGDSLFSGVSQLYLCGGQQTFGHVIATTPLAGAAPLNIASLATTGVPEPGTISLLLAGSALLAGWKIRR